MNIDSLFFFTLRYQIAHHIIFCLHVCRAVSSSPPPPQFFPFPHVYNRNTKLTSILRVVLVLSVTMFTLNGINLLLNIIQGTPLHNREGLCAGNAIKIFLKGHGNAIKCKRPIIPFFRTYF